MDRSARKWIVPVALGALVVVGLVVFAPWRPPGFVSDSWFLLWRFGQSDLADPLARFVPEVGAWYRPLTEAGFWLTWKMFGLDPTGHFIARVALHAGTAVILAALAMTLTGSRLAALATGFAFLFALQSHEVVWDHSALHLSLVAPLIAGTVLVHLHGRAWLAAVLGVAALLVDEAGMLIVPLVLLYELVFADLRSVSRRSALAGALKRVAPLTLILVAYLVTRLTIGEGFFNEVAEPCRDPRCVAIGLIEYINRLVVRGEPLIALLWTLRIPVALAVATVLAVGAAVLRPWRWSDLRPALFAFGWAAGTSAFFVYALFPYVADRFAYIPTMGVSLLIGAAIAEVARRWPETSSTRRAATAGVGLVLICWLALGVLTVQQRGTRWVAAGERALALARGVARLVAEPPSGAVVLVYGMPHSLSPAFPPGNTGPYVYLNGMSSAMRLLYDWRGVLVPTQPQAYERPTADTPLIYLEAVDDVVRPLPGPPEPQP